MIMTDAARERIAKLKAELEPIIERVNERATLQHFNVGFEFSEVQVDIWHRSFDDHVSAISHDDFKRFSALGDEALITLLQMTSRACRVVEKEATDAGRYSAQRQMHDALGLSVVNGALVLRGDADRIAKR